MTDSGLVLNFAAGEISLPKASPKFKGGSWKERARLTRSSKFPRSSRLEDVKQLQQKTRDDPDRSIESILKQPGTDERQIHEHIRPTGRNDTFTRGSDSKGRDGDRARAGRKESRPNLRRDDNPPTKRRKTDQDHTKNKFHLEGASYGGQPGNREVISSLFTYNPEAKLVDDQKEMEEPTKPSNAPLPDGIDTFTSLGLSETVAAYLLTKLKLKNPTAIQKEAIPQLTKEDADVFIQSETGSGKTLAYLLPIVQRLITTADRQQHEGEGVLQRDSGLFAIVIAPTRELCKQISVVLERLLGCAHFIVAGTVIGGEKKKSEKARLRKGLNILVATPGRLADHLDNTKTLDVGHVRYLVLDEGDRLMDLGFEEDITKIVRALDERRSPSDKPGLPNTRVTILCSATLKANVEKLGDISLKDAVLVKGETEADDKDIGFLAPAQLKQSYVVCAAKLRLVTLTALLKRTFARKGSVMKAIVFFSCADSIEFHHKIFARGGEDDLSPTLSTENNNVKIFKLHGSLPQQSRTAILKGFATSNDPSLLLATDVASRGLDLPNLDLVIEYDPAFSKDDHLHRIGRTARLGRNGRAVIFLMPGSEEGYVDILRESYRSEGNVTANSANEILKKGFTPNGIVTEDWQKAATEFQLDVERWVLNEKDLAKNAFTSHVRAYATHISSERKYFNIKQLHLGHLAKAFGLRDPPGKVNVAGLRTPKANEGRKRVDIDEVGDAEEAAGRMRQLVRNQKKMTGSGADEFNIA